MPREQTYRPADASPPPPTGIGDVALMLWRERGFMLVVFLICFVLLAGAAYAVFDKTYTARTSLLVRLDEAYAYNPVLGQASAGGSFGIDQIIQSEVNILNAEVLKQRTLETMGLRAVYPDLANDFVEAAPGDARDRVFAQAVRRVSQNLSVGSAPGAANIQASFTHERADTASRFLNALVAEYLRYRPEVLLSYSPEGYADRREDYEARLAGANRALEGFLQENEIGDFESYRAGLQERQVDVAAALYAAQADLAQTQAQLGALRSRMSQLPAEIEQYVDNDASGRLLDLMLEREELRSRYTDDSIPVQEIDQRIAQLSQFVAAGGAEGAGSRRVGPNPVRQALETDELQLTGQAAALDRRVAELTRQRNQLQDEQIRIQGLAPQYERLARDISSLQATVDAIATRQEADRAQRDLASGALDNVSIVQPAVPPSQGSSMKKPAMAGALIVSGFISLLAGLVRGVLRGGPLTWPAWTAPVRTAPRPVQAARPKKAAAQPRYLDEAAAAPDPYDPPPRLPVLAVIQKRADPAPSYV